MRIGSRSTTALARQPSRSAANPEAFGAGVGAALSRIANTIGDSAETRLQLQKQMEERQSRQAEAEATIELQRRVGETRRTRIETRTNVEPGAANYTNNMNELLDRAWEDFAGNYLSRYPNLSEEARTRLQSTWEAERQSALTSDFSFELDEGNRHVVSQVESLLDEALLRVREDPTALEAEYAALASIVGTSNLPIAQFEELDQQVYQALAGVAFERLHEQAAQGVTPVRPVDDGDVVAAGIPAQGRTLLNIISGVESQYPGANRYNVLYGGQEFEGYTDHPRITRRIEHGEFAGQTTSAAGRYQFLASTWDFVRERMEAEGYDFGPEVFSPVNQDRAALWYANYRYRQAARAAGLPVEWQDLNAALLSGQPEIIAQVRQLLGGQGANTAWEGLQNLSDEEFVSLVTGEQGIQRGGTGFAEGPDVWTDPRFAGLTYQQRAELETRGAQRAAAAQQQRAAEQLAADQAVFAGLREQQALGGPSIFDQAMAALPTVRDQDTRNDILRLVQDDIDQRQNAQDVQVAVAAGRPLGPQDAGAVDDFLLTTGASAGLANQAPEAAAAVVQTFQRTGVMGTETLNSLLAMTQHANPQSQIYALDTLARMAQTSPFAFASLRNEEARDAGLLWSQHTRLAGNSQQALENYNRLRTPEGANIRRQRVEEATELLESISPTDMLIGVAGQIARLTGSAQLLPGEPSNNFIELYTRAFTDGYLMLGSEDGASNYANEVMSSVFHPDPLSGSMEYLSAGSPMAQSLVRNRPEGDWVEEALMAQLPQLERAQEIRLITTAETLESVRAGETPVYGVMQLMDDGSTGLVLGDDNRPVQFRLEPTLEQVQQQETNRQRDHYIDRLNVIERELQGENTTALERSLADLESRYGQASPLAQRQMEMQIRALRQQLEETRGAQDRYRALREEATDIRNRLQELPTLPRDRTPPPPDRRRS